MGRHVLVEELAKDAALDMLVGHALPASYVGLGTLLLM